jgi:hypothetical protein
MRPLLATLRKGFESLFKGVFNLGGSGAAAFAKGGVLSRGQVTPFASGGVIAAPTYFPLRGGLGVMGERGAEAIVPLARGPDGRLGVRSGGEARPIAVTVNVTTPDADSFRRSEAQVWPPSPAPWRGAGGGFEGGLGSRSQGVAPAWPHRRAAMPAQAGPHRLATAKI